MYGNAVIATVVLSQKIHHDKNNDQPEVLSESVGACRRRDDAQLQLAGGMQALRRRDIGSSQSVVGDERIYKDRRQRPHHHHVA